jgi:uracil-DNA glycosylase
MRYNAFNRTPFDKVKVVIIGQDPYHGEGQANGLSFSVTKGMKLPPSLVNIFKEISSDLGIPIRGENGDLGHWASQGVLLLNASLTVRANEPMSHARIGWKQFTDTVIQRLSIEKKNDRCKATLDPGGCSPFSFVCSKWIFRMQAFFPDK